MAADGIGKSAENIQCKVNNFEQVLADNIKDNHLAAAQHLFSDCIGTRAMAQAQTQANPDAGKDNGISVYKVMPNLAQVYSQTIDATKSSVWEILKRSHFKNPDLAFKLDAVPEE